MIKKTTILALLLLVFTSQAQNGPVDFETGGFGADWTWTVFENDTNPALEIVANPDTSGLNTSATVAKFTALQTGAPFAGVESMHGADIGTFTLSPENAIVKILVYKSVISDVGIKFATAAGASTGEIKVPNTLIDQWEELTFDFTGVINEPSSTDIDQLIVFPDFDTRTSDNIIYFDFVSFGDGVLNTPDSETTTRIQPYPNPMNNFWQVISQDLIKSISVFDAFGKELMQIYPNSNEHQLEVSNFSSGIYLFQVRTEKESRIYKVVKE